MDHIRIRFTRYSAFYAPLLLAMGAGHLRDEGIEAAYDTVAPDRTLEDGIARGEVQVGQSAPAAAFAPQEAGVTLPFRHFALMNARDGFFLAARTGSGIATWADLAGRSIVADHYFQPMGFLRRALAVRGVDDGRVTFLDAGTPAEMDRAFRDGTGDILHVQGPAAQQLEAEGLARIVGSVGEAVGPVVFSTLVAGPDWLGSAVAGRFSAAFGRAREQARTADPGWIADAIAPFLPGATRPALTATIAAYQAIGTWEGGLAITPALFAGTVAVFRFSGHITRDPSPDGILAPTPGS
ncbi:MAG: ABC transporter substrate-binding protein [Chloroflexota bacterium]